jgi:hypothetical protein
MKKFCSFLVCAMLLFTCPFSSLASGGNPFTDAFSLQYSPMTDAEVSAKLSAVPLAPEGGGILPQLSGKSYRITNEGGFAFDVAFDAQGAGVSVSAQLPPAFGATEPTQEAFESEYAGLASGDFALVGFRVPDTARAWAVVWNLKTGLAAVYEVFFAETIDIWFGGLPTPAREAQRNVYLGKAEGVGSSAAAPTATNRLTGKAVLWENDLGSFYTNYGTRSWSAFYPLGQPEGLAGSWTTPSDYFDFHDTRHFVYSRTESVYSGATLVELLDLHLVSQIGLKIGFDASDALEFKLYSGKGKILGSYAAYGGFAADEYPDGMFGRFAYRPNSEKLTREEVVQAIEDEGSWTGAFGGPGKDEKMYPLTDKLSGKSCSLVFDDGLTLEYQITGVNELRFREAGAQEWKTGRCEAFEVDANLIFFTHAIDDAFPDKIYLNVVDFDNGLATCMNSEILVDETNPRMCIPSFHFGVINMAGITPVSQRHGFSEGLLGTSFTWTYNDSMVSQHYYATPDSLYYAIMGSNGEAFLMWSCDAWYVKFRENVYLISWLESFGSGQNDSKVFNLNTMHDAGVCYGIPDGAPFEYNTYGSEARHAGTVDVSSIYGKDEQVKVPDSVVTPSGPPSGSGTLSPSGGGGGASAAPSATPSATPGTTPSAATQPADSVGDSGEAVAGEAPSRFSDDTAVSSWARPGIERLLPSGVLSGYADGTLGPARNVTRAEFAKMIVGTLGLSAGAATTSFADVVEGAWYKQYVDIASSLDLVNGTGEGYFSPDLQISRQDLSAIAYRAIQSRGAAAPAYTGEPFSDDAQIAPYAKEAVYALKEIGVVSGRSTGAFDPLAPATREETAKILCGVDDYIRAAR